MIWFYSGPRLVSGRNGRGGAEGSVSFGQLPTAWGGGLLMNNPQMVSGLGVADVWRQRYAWFTSSPRGTLSILDRLESECIRLQWWTEIRLSLSIRVHF